MEPRAPLSSRVPLFDTEVGKKILDLITSMGANPDSAKADVIGQMIYTGLKMIGEEFDMGQLKLMIRSLKEMRYAYRIFNEHRHGQRCVSIFGSARTPQTHPDYQAALAFSMAMSANGWFCITGAADGIMRAGLEGVKNDAGFGLSIRLPFEEPTHSVLAGDPKLISFRYFFTRKLMFVSHADAFAAFPGGLGTQDELFEVLTLMQTGRANLVPIVLIEGEKGHYWQAWEHYIQNHLLANGWISAEDQYLYYRAPGVQAAIDHIEHFYRRYHSSRYVKNTLVIRLAVEMTPLQLATLNQEFRPLVQEGDIYATSAFPEESDHLNLPRIAFVHNRKHFGLLRALIDRINGFD